MVPEQNDSFTLVIPWLSGRFPAVSACGVGAYAVISTHQYRVKVVGVAVRIRFVDSKRDAVSKDRHQYQILERSVDDIVKEYTTFSVFTFIQPRKQPHLQFLTPSV